jgi:CBS domain containing-hemolysin-like protein
MDSIWLPLVIITVLIVLNGFFVAAEFAIVAAPRLSLEQRAKSGQRIAARALAIMTTPRRQDQFIATAQLGITFASLGLGMYGEHVLAEWIAGGLEGTSITRYVAAHALASVTSIGLLTYLHIVIGEMVPKSLALQRAEGTLMAVTPAMGVVRTILHPLVVALNAIGTAVMALAGINRQAPSPEQYHSPEELQLVVEESQRAGVLSEESRDLLSGIFEFGEKTASAVMVPRVRITGLPVGMPASRVEEVLRRVPKARYPVYEGDLDHIIGVIHVKDLLRLMVAGAPVTSADARAMPAIPETLLLDEVLAAMRRERTHMALVVDEHGGVAGIVTLEDLVEEVVGEIQDSDDVAPIVHLEDGRRRVLGTVRLDELGDELGMMLEHPDVDSVSGLVLAMVGRAVRVGDVVHYAGLRFEVTTVVGLGVGECVVSGRAL